MYEVLRYYISITQIDFTITTILRAATIATDVEVGFTQLSSIGDVVYMPRYSCMLVAAKFFQ